MDQINMGGGAIVLVIHFKNWRTINTTMVHNMKRNNIKYGQTMCEGGGQAMLRS